MKMGKAVQRSDNVITSRYYAKTIEIITTDQKFRASLPEIYRLMDREKQCL